ncbi:UDP-N-acetylglucosamine 1-carboxyvinyltransferase, partial [Mesorhizobium sp. M7A.F.Ca.CA.004.01.1.1]|uniref:UDP-N-acetylglucosamine 1-carboxyvinyltransferase n=1 Tax=Mesorhizobium sp. M7A.F.Ca.CA.004.01.1.1 TaxID=2496689 RepID=UPI000FCB098A
MDRIRIVGGNKLSGSIPISGAKNAALPLMIASLLTDDTLTLENVPHLADVEQLIRILGNHGVDYSVNGRREKQNEGYSRTINFSARNIVDTTAPYELVSKMRASFWVIGPLLARMGEAKVSLPGGCAIGTRPVDLFLEGLQALGADIDVDTGYVIAKTRNGRLVGNRYIFPKVSVGATHVLMMAAALAKGETVLENAACEPEIVNLAECLNAMGAKISGAGTPTITIDGVESLSGARVRVIPDRIETGTYAMAVAMTGGDVVLEGARPDLLQTALDVIAQTGAEITPTNSGIRVRRNGAGISPVDVTTAPFPAFPTDLQAQFMGLMTMAKGKSRITETIFENRFMHVQELARLGAHITLSGQTAIVDGVPKLKGAPVMATDLRASVSLVIAGLAAEGETTVNRVYHLDRGFERLEEKRS